MEAHGRVGTTMNEEPVSINYKPNPDILETWTFLLSFQKVLGMKKGLSYEELTAEINGSSFDGLVEAQVSMLKTLMEELPQKLGQFKKVVRKSSATSKISEIKLPPVNNLTWPELARRYVLATLFLSGELKSSEVCEGMDVIRCLCGDGRPRFGPLTGVSGLEKDANVLAAAAKEIYGSMSEEIPGWVQELEPIKKLKTNVGSRIRNCIKKSLEKNPPGSVKQQLVHSISKGFYKGNASGPTKKIAVQIVDEFRGTEKVPQDPVIRKTISDIVMKQCRIVLRQAAAMKQTKKFRNLLGDKMVVCGSYKEGLLGSPVVLSSLLYLRMIDLRLAAGAYCGSHEAFFEDVQEFWKNVQIAFGNNPDLVKLAEESCHAFESLYLKEVVPLQQKLEKHHKSEPVGAVSNKSIEDIVGASNEIPKAPWDKGICKVCGVDQEDKKVLLCDLCDAEYHIYCLSPPLASVPQGSWFCPCCVADENIAQDTLSGSTSVGQEQKKQDGDFVDSVHNKIADVADAMRGKEYSELTSSERIILLKFFCNKMLDSDLIEDHFEKYESFSSKRPKSTDTTESASPSNRVESSSVRNYCEASRYSLRTEFLGVDSVGKLYWIVDTDTGPWIIVNGIDEQNQDGQNSEDLAENWTLKWVEKLWSCEGSEAYSYWACYRSEVEIRGAIDSLKDDDQVKRQLEEALSQQRSRINVPRDESKSEGEELQQCVIKQGQDLTTNGTRILKTKGNYVPFVQVGIQGKVSADGTEEVDVNPIQPLMGKAFDILGQLKVNLLDMEAAIPEGALRSHEACIHRRHAWREFVQRASTIIEMVWALIVFEDMIKLNYLDCSWRYWSSLSAAAEISTLSALSLRIYSLDAAIKYENSCGPSDVGEANKKRKRVVVNKAEP